MVFLILLMPWINPQNEVYALGMMGETRSDTLLGHLEIDGFQMYAGHESQGGLSEKFQKFDTVMSGSTFIISLMTVKSIIWLPV